MKITKWCRVQEHSRRYRTRGNMDKRKQINQMHNQDAYMEAMSAGLPTRTGT